MFSYDEGTDVYVDTPDLQPGAASEGVRIVRARADARTLRLVVQGRGRREYVVNVRTPRQLGSAAGVTVSRTASGDQQLRIAFEGDPEAYVRRDLVIPLLVR